MNSFLFGDRVQIDEDEWKKHGVSLPELYGLRFGTEYKITRINKNLIWVDGSDHSFHYEFFKSSGVELAEDDFIIYKGWKLPKRYAEENATEVEKAMFETFKKSADKHAGGPHTEKESDAVHSPKHYAVFDDIEAIEVIARSMTQEMFKGYCFGNLLKYRLRVGGKDEVMQELGKADKYKELYEKFKGLCQ